MTPDNALAVARGLVASRQYAQAEAQLALIEPDHPDYGEALRLTAAAAAERRDWRSAEAAAAKSIAVNGERIDDLWILALAKRNHREFAGGARLFRRLIAESPTETQVRRAYGSLNYCLVGLQQWPAAEKLLREAMARFPADAVLVTDLAENLLKQGRDAEAVEVARQALALDQGQVRARTLLSISSHKSAKPARKHRLAPFPKRVEAFADAADVISKTLLRGYPDGDRFISPSTRFLTLGSCFATNLAVRLRESGLGRGLINSGPQSG